MFRGNERIREEGYATDLFRREALGFIGKNKDRPFFLYLAFNAPHGASTFEKDKLQVPEKYVQLYKGADPAAARTKHRAMITCMDEASGEILDRLRELGLEKDTLVLFSSDNGGTKTGDNGPLRGFKAQMFEGGIRVPLLARWPGRLPAGKTTGEFLSSLELFPTLLAAAGVKPPDGVVLDGFDMLPVLQGRAASSRTEMFWERRRDRAARVGSYKWVDSAEGKGLFDLERDPGEQSDLSAEKPDVLARLQGRFAAWKQAMDAAEPRGPFRDH
jgi:arylsulfatase A-like enzyme